MSEGAHNSELPSLDFANRLEILLDDKAKLLAEIDQEVNDLKDPDNDTMQRLWTEAYHELFYDTPAAEMLWQGERLLGEFSTHTFRSYKIDGLEDIARIDLIEAYAIVMPDEGFRLFKDWDNAIEKVPIRVNPDSAVVVNPRRPSWADEEKVEALAKFGRLTHPIFVHHARDLALSSSESWGKTRFEMFLAVANFGNDVKSLGLAYQAIIDYATNFRKSDSPADIKKAIDREWNLFVDLAALGHWPAIQQAKQSLINLQPAPRDRNPYLKQTDWVNAVATVELIDDGIHAGKIPLRVGPDPAHMEQDADIRKQWDDMVVHNRHEIVAALRNLDSLPNTSCYTRKLFDGYNIAHQLDECSVFQDVDDFKRYVYPLIDGYVAKLVSEGPSAIDGLLRDTKDTTAYRMPMPMIKARHEAFLRAHPHAEIEFAIITRKKYTDEGQANALNYQLQEILPEVNLLCLVRATAIAAARLAST